MVALNPVPTALPARLCWGEAVRQVSPLGPSSHIAHQGQCMWGTQGLWEQEGAGRPDVMCGLPEQLPGSCCFFPGPQRPPGGSPHAARWEDCSPDGLWGLELNTQSPGGPVSNEFVAAHAPFVQNECPPWGAGCGNPPGTGLPPKFPSVQGGGRLPGKA
jgi:hypothetical protein